MKVFITGVSGQLGHDVLREVQRRGCHGIGSVGRVASAGSEFIPLDITDASAVDRVFSETRPDALIHCAAWTDVDGAEDPVNRETVYRINAVGTENLARAALAVNAKMVYVSTDYISGGQGAHPMQPEDRNFVPLNWYGRTKLAGELAVSSVMSKYFIVRTAWMFGANGKNFVNTMVNLGRTHDTVCVVNDQIGTPTYTRDLARLLVDMIETEQYGYYHATNAGGYISWYDFAKEIYRQAGLFTEVIPVSTAEFRRSRAARPLNSRLDISKLAENGFQPLPDWKDALTRYLKEAKLYYGTDPCRT